MDNRFLGILGAFQHADSFFPSGATSMSGGLEALVADGLAFSGKDVESFLTGQLRCRWTSFERPGLVFAIRHFSDPTALAEVDRQLHAQSLAAEGRNGSVRTGRALLRVHADMKTDGAAEYQELIKAGVARGHNSVVQGLVWGKLGIAGLVGHTEAQSILTRVHEVILTSTRQPCLSVENISSFSPQQEIGLMRHEKFSSRLFFN
jgi:urease accessory protein